MSHSTANTGASVTAGASDTVTTGAVSGAMSDAIPSPQPDGTTLSESWKKRLTAAQRVELAALHRLTPWTQLKVLVLLLIWVVAAAIAIRVPSLWVRVPCWAIIGFVLHGLGVFMHEGAHCALFRKPWLDRPVGFLCGLPVFFPCSSYRATHLLHHQYENTARDPDNLEANFPHPILRTLLYYGWFVAGMPVYIVLVTFTGPFRARGWANKLACVIEPLLIAGFYWGLFTVAGRYQLTDVLVNGWAWAIPFAVLIANVRGLAEHTQLWHRVPPDQLHSTRSLVSNAWIRFFFNNQNHHLEHHLFPAVPWNNLSKVHRLMQPIYQQRRASVTKGYGQWIRDALRYGPTRTLSYLDKRSRVDPPHPPWGT